MAKTPAPTILAPAPTGADQPKKRDPFRHLKCKDWGKGGQYVEGPDGKRVPVDPPKPADPAPADHQE